MQQPKADLGPCRHAVHAPAWDGGQNEYMWIHDVDGALLVVGIHLGYDVDEDWDVRARAVLESLAIT